MTRRRDDDLVARAKDGDADAWRALYQTNATRLKVWLETIPTGDSAADSDDIAASAWLTASRRIDTFIGTSSDFAGWLFSIARNIALTTRATGTRRATYPTDVASSDPGMWGHVDDPATSVDAAELAYQLIQRLSPREAEVVACIDVAGFDISTTATILDLTEVAVRVAHHRGIGRLRSLLSGSGVPGAPTADFLRVSPHPSPGGSS
jgi:RNA polymerase sigma-70 factor (ECF subfamily)